MDQDPRQALARRLRSLREERWPNMKITQPQLAHGLGGEERPLSVPLISSWESPSNPKIPPIPRLEAYATFFATERSVAENPPRMLSSAEMNEPERRARDELLRELMSLRREAMRATDTPGPNVEFEAFSSGPWRFDDGKPITIVCAQLPAEVREKLPYSDPADPDYVALYSYSDIDALFELHGHLRAANPMSQVNLRAAQRLAPDDYTTHLITIGGVDWNLATVSLFDKLQLPVRQVADWKSPKGPYFVTGEADHEARHHPRLEQVGDRKILLEDVALFARAVNPYNKKRTVSICNGMYGAGSFGAVRALTDARFRDRNAAYLQERFAGSESFCILTRVTVENGAPLTPDWEEPESRLFEWKSSQ